MGTVEQVSEDRLTLRGPAGPITVTLRPETTVRKATDAARTDLAPGAVVMVSGQRGSNGEVAAASVLVLPSEFAGPAGAGSARRPGAARP